MDLLFVVVVVALPVLIIWTVAKSLLDSRGRRTYICTTCGHLGRARLRVKGSFALEIFLWLLLIIPGLIYSIWRMSTRHPRCASCDAPTLVPPDSPVGRRLTQENHLPR